MATKRQRSRGNGSLYRRAGRGNWIARWFAHDGRRREESTRTTDRATAERLLAKRIADARLRSDGVVDARTDRYADADRQSLAVHVSDWTDALTGKGVTTKQVATLRVRVNGLIASTKAERLSDMSASKIQSALGALRKGDKPLSLQTVHHHLRAIKQFSRWLNADGRLRDDPLAHLSISKPASDRRYERRALDADELRWLIRSTESAAVWRGLSGVNRAMLYRVATGTGFRASELRSLTTGSVRLHNDTPGIVLRAGSSKRRTEDHQPIRADLADTLRPWLDGRRSDAPLWPGHWNEKAATMIRGDLRRSRAQWIKAATSSVERRERNESGFLAVTDDTGRVVDFHALRVTFITALARGGASVKATQELARHSDPKLTLNAYTTLGIHDLTGALDALPSMTDDSPNAESLRATGTYDGSPENTPARYHPKPRQLARETVQNGASGCNENRTKTSAVQTPKHSNYPAKTACFKGEMKTATGRTRTDDLRFTKPLLYQLSYGGAVGARGGMGLHAVACVCDSTGFTIASKRRVTRTDVAPRRTRLHRFAR